MRKSHKNSWVLYLLVGAVVYIFGRQILTRIMLSKCSRVTVGIPYAVSGGFKTGNSLNFYYYVNEQRYEVSQYLGNGSYTEGAKNEFMAHRRYIRFSCQYPSLSKVEIGKEVLAAVVKIPPEGWDKIPEASY